MELTLDQALQKGVEAHKAGKVQEADRYYTAILQTQPTHPDANHNMGVLAVGVGKTEVALPFFKTALQSNPSIAQFWLSYIDALTLLGRLGEAKTALTEAKENGAKGGGFEELEQKLNVATTVHSPLPYNKIFESAIQFRENGDFNQAIKVLNQGLIQLPNSADLFALLSHCHLLKDEIDQAIMNLEKAEAIDKNSAQVGWMKARLLLKQNNLAGALVVAKRFNKLSPEDAEGFGIIGTCLRAYKDFENSLIYLNKAIEKKPDYAEALINRGLIWRSKKEVSAALTDLEQAHRLKPHMKQIWETILALKLELRQFSENILFLKGLTKIDPTYWKGFFYIGFCHQQLGEFEEAIEAYNEALSLKSDYADAYNNIGIILAAQGKLSDGIHAYKKAIENNPDFAAAYNNMGQAMVAQGKQSEAIEAYNRSISLKPDYAEAFYNLGIVLVTMGRLDDAIYAYKKAIENNPNYAEAYNNMGLAFNQKGQIDQAIGAYKKAIENNPNYADAYSNMGAALYESDRLDEGIDAYKKATENNPGHDGAFNNMGILLYKQGAIEKALEAYEEALKIDPNNANAWNNLFYSLYAMKPQGFLRKNSGCYHHDSAGYKYTDIANSTLNYKLTRGAKGSESFFSEALSHLSDLENKIIKSPKFDKKNLKGVKPSGLNNVVALAHFGRSGTGLLHSLIDSHPEVSTLPSIYFSEYFDRSTWEGITAGGWDEMSDRFMAIYDVLFDASSKVPVETKGRVYLAELGQKEGMASVGKDRNEVLSVNKEVFNSELKRLMGYHEQLDAFVFFKLVHQAYDKAISDLNKKKLIFYHIHNPGIYSNLNFVGLAPDAKWVLMVREPLQSCESWVQALFDQNDNAQMGMRLRTMLFEFDNIVYHKQSSIGVRLEDLKEKPYETIPALCKWMGIEEDKSLYEMTAQGKKWWGDPTSPDYATDGMNPFGKTSINRKIGSVFSESDQFILNTLFYPFSVRFGYVDENLEQFKINLQKIKPMFDKMFDFEKQIVEKTNTDPEKFMKSGPFLYLRSCLIERWNTLNEFGTYPNMIKPLRLSKVF
jgi:tetratricopeptide (TPR) repeat protein